MAYSHLRLFAFLPFLITFGSPDSGWCQPAVEEDSFLTASDADTNENFGRSVAIDGDTLFVGADGKFYVFDWDAEELEWVESQIVEESDGDFAGVLEARDGRLLVSGCDNHFYEFDSDEDEWVEVETIPTCADFVWDGVRIADGTVRVYGFDLDEDDWVEEGYVDVDWYELSSLGFAGETIIHGHTSYFDEIGTATVYQWDDTEAEFVETQTLSPSFFMSRNFGAACLVEGDLAFVGAPASLSDTGGVGQVYAYEYDDEEEEWVETQWFGPADANYYTNFGRTIDKSGDLLVVGTDNEQAHMFNFDEDLEEWNEVVRLIPTGHVAYGGDDFAYSAVAIEGLRVVVGAPREDTEASNAGAVYVYDFTPRPFLRGDADGDGEVIALIDALFILYWMYGEGDTPPCLDAVDVDGDDEIMPLMEALHLLQWAFVSGDAPPDPGTEECGLDPSGLGRCQLASAECD